jgi:hypothetical protein
MAATITVRRWTGTSGSPTKTDVTSGTVVFVTADTQYSAGSAYPIPIPSSSSNYSYWVAFRLSVDVTPTGTVNNIKAYSDGASSLPTGVTLVGNTATSYIQATGTPGTTGLLLNTTNYSTLAGATADVFGWTSGASKSITGTLSNPSTGDFGDFLVLQMAVASTATTTGETTGEVMTWVWDET